MLVVFLVCSVDFVWWWFVVVLYGYAWMVEPVSVVVVRSSLRRDCFAWVVESGVEEAWWRWARCFPFVLSFSFVFRFLRL